MQAIIDIGSNTIRLTVYNRAGNSFQTVFSEKETAGLANLKENERLTDEGIARACEALINFKEILQNLKIEDISVFATASLRNISNTKEAVAAIQNKTGFVIDVVSGEKEALLDFAGAMYCIDAEDGVLIDIGGGSTEIVRFEKKKVKEAMSAPVGSLSLYKRFVKKILPGDNEIRDMQRLIEKEFKGISANAMICGVGGTVRGVLKLYNKIYGAEKQNLFMEREKLNQLGEKLLADKAFARDMILKVCPDRIHTILPGLLILMRFCQSSDVVVSKYGAREGYFITYKL